jgi:hypothetical protein
VADANARKDQASSKTADERYWRQDEVEAKFSEFEDNFRLSYIDDPVIETG